jgi:nitroreductase
MFVNAEDFLDVIKKRQSTRVPYDPSHAILKEDLNQILEAARWTPTPHNMQNFDIIVVDDKKLLETIGNINYTISDEFIKENYQQLSFSEEELRKKKVGLLGTMFPPELRNPEKYRKSGPNEKIVSFVGELIETSPILLIIIYNPNLRAPASEGDFLGIMGLGCLMENMWLMAQALGIDFHVISALNADSVEKELKNLLIIPDEMKIALGIRLGYSLSPYRNRLRIRRDVEDFVHYNKFR